MKWYLHTHHNIHLKQIKEAKDDLARFFPHVIQVANSFPRDGIAIGALNFQDLYQAGYVGLIQAYNKVDWERINEAPNPNAELWSFLKKRIKWAIRREIDKYGQFISRPINMQEEERNKLQLADHILVNVFPQFFDEELKIFDETITNWDNEQLGILIDELLLKYVGDYTHVQIIRFFYGLDCEKLSVKEIATKYNSTPGNIRKIKQRAIEKLRNEDVEKIIKNFYEN